MAFEEPRDSLESTEGAEIKEAYREWDERYSDALESFGSRENFTKDELVDLIFEKGILDHLAPTDEKEREARKAMKADLWDRDNVDHEFYWRIMYSSGALKESLGQDLAVTHGYVARSAIKALYKIGGTHEAWTKIFPDVSEEDTPLKNIAEALEERARHEIKNRGGIPHEQLIPIGAKGTVNGVAVKVERYTGEGMVSLHTDNYEDWVSLGDEVKSVTGRMTNIVSPTMLDPENFK